MCACICITYSNIGTYVCRYVVLFVFLQLFTTSTKGVNICVCVVDPFFDALRKRFLTFQIIRSNRIKRKRKAMSKSNYAPVRGL